MSVFAKYCVKLVWKVQNLSIIANNTRFQKFNPCPSLPPPRKKRKILTKILTLLGPWRNCLTSLLMSRKKAKESRKYKIDYSPTEFENLLWSYFSWMQVFSIIARGTYEKKSLWDIYQFFSLPIENVHTMLVYHGKMVDIFL